MIKNKVMDIKIIFKNIKNKLKIFQVLQQIFILQNIKNYFLNYFKKIVNKA